MTAKTNVFASAGSIEKRYFQMFLLSILMWSTGCVTDMIEPIIEEPVVRPEVDMHMGFEDPSEPFQVLPDRPIDASDSGNGCLPGVPWNNFYVYNVCISPTSEISDFAIERNSKYTRVGAYSARFFLRPTSIDQWPLGEASHRAELRPNSRAPFDRYPQEGQVRWYGMSVFFSEDFVFAPESLSNELRFMIAQWQHGTTGSPTVAFEVHGNRLELARSKGVSTASEWIQPNFLANISRGQWMDLVVQIKWSKEVGAIKIWVNDAAVYQRENIQTMYHNLSVGGGLKMGIYHWRWKEKKWVEESLRAGITNREIYIDEVREYLGDAGGYNLVAPGAN
ncbi:MAG: hypothetical protein HKN87_10500 [Saprospiraceae bacterium]|nr:hypothetical protein [Saprospiraceae bacterium]